MKLHFYYVWMVLGVGSMIVSSFPQASSVQYYLMAGGMIFYYLLGRGQAAEDSE